jgi:hypothetical protein
VRVITALATGTGRRSSAPAPLPRELLPRTAQPHLRAQAELAAAATAAFAVALRVSVEAPLVAPGTLAGGASAERVPPQRYYVRDTKQASYYDQEPHAFRV